MKNLGAANRVSIVWFNCPVCGDWYEGGNSEVQYASPDPHCSHTGKKCTDPPTQGETA